MHGPCSPVSLTGAETAGRKGGHDEWDGHLNKHIKKAMHCHNMPCSDPGNRAYQWQGHQGRLKVMAS